MKAIERLQQRNRNFNKRYLKAPKREKCEELASTFIGKHATKLKHDQVVIDTAFTIFKRHMDTRGVRISNPSAVAFAAHYIAAHLEGRPRTFEEIRSVAGVSAVTLNKYCMDIFDGMGVEPDKSVDWFLFEKQNHSKINKAIEKWR